MCTNRESEKRIHILVQTLDLREEESLQDLLTRAMPTIRALNKRSTQAFELYYSCTHNKAMTVHAIGMTIGTSCDQVRFLRSKAEMRLEEVLGTMRAEEAMPERYALWNPRWFFTSERGIAENLPIDLIKRITRNLESPSEQFPCVRELCRLTEQQVPGKFHYLGKTGAAGMQKMLQTVGLSFTAA